MGSNVDGDKTRIRGLNSFPHLPSRPPNGSTLASQGQEGVLPVGSCLLQFLCVHVSLSLWRRFLPEMPKVPLPLQTALETVTSPHCSPTGQHLLALTCDAPREQG